MVPWKDVSDVEQVFSKCELFNAMFLCNVFFWLYVMVACPFPSLPHTPAVEPKNPDLQGSKEKPLHLVMMSGGLLINNGAVFPGTQSRECSVLAAAGPG